MTPMRQQAEGIPDSRAATSSKRSLSCFERPYPMAAATPLSLITASGTGSLEPHAPAADTLEEKNRNGRWSASAENWMMLRTPLIHGVNDPSDQLKLTGH